MLEEDRFSRQLLIDSLRTNHTGLLSTLVSSTATTWYRFPTNGRCGYCLLCGASIQFIGTDGEPIFEALYIHGQLHAEHLGAEKVAAAEVLYALRKAPAEMTGPTGVGAAGGWQQVILDIWGCIPYTTLPE